jgi:hypothetical protein
MRSECAETVVEEMCFDSSNKYGELSSECIYVIYPRDRYQKSPHSWNSHLYGIEVDTDSNDMMEMN